MDYSLLGNTGISVSKLGVGTGLFGVAPLANDVDKLVGAAIDNGINLFDTANSYGNSPHFDRPGAPPAAQRLSAEELLGKALKGRRDRIVLCSKVMEPVGPGPNDRGLSRVHIFNQIERSLRRLGTDHLDIYYAHHPDPATPIEETLRAFDDLVSQGKIRHAALSTYSGWQMVEALWATDRLGLRSPACHQILYNLAHRDPERELVPICERYGSGLIAFSPLAGGLLAGREVRQRSAVGRLRWGGTGFSEAEQAVAAALEEVSDQVGWPAPALALGWLLRMPKVASVLLGAETAAELKIAVEHAEALMNDEIFSMVNAINGACKS